MGGVLPVEVARAAGRSSGRVRDGFPDRAPENENAAWLWSGGDPAPAVEISGVVHGSTAASTDLSRPIIPIDCGPAAPAVARGDL